MALSDFWRDLGDSARGFWDWLTGNEDQYDPNPGFAGGRSTADPSASDTNDYNILDWEGIMEANREAQMLAAVQQQEFELSAAREANQFSAGQAQLNRDWQTAANKLAMDFESREAEIQRNWIDQQRSTAYQTAVEDLKKAGLNPVLAASGSGAAVTSGSMASGVSSAGSAAQGVKASGSKADTDVTTYTQLTNSLLNSAFAMARDSMNNLYGQMSDIRKIAANLF